MAHRIVILGGRTGGTLAANRQHRVFGERAEIAVVDRDDLHLYQPALLFVPFGLARPGEITRSRRALLHEAVELHLAEVECVDLAANAVRIEDGAVLSYDALVVASGATLAPEETEGLTASGWNERIFTFYILEGADALRGGLERFHRGRLVVNVVDMPIKCPVAPLEFCFLADRYLRECGVRDDIEITYVTPLDNAFTRPVAAEHLGEMLARDDIALETELATGEIEGETGRLRSWDEREVPFAAAGGQIVFT
jgi:sulfide:quinone oxidoreductase